MFKVFMGVFPTPGVHENHPKLWSSNPFPQGAQASVPEASASYFLGGGGMTLWFRGGPYLNNW